MRQARGHLTESGEALGPARVVFGAPQLAIGFLKRLRERLIARDLPAIFNDEAVHQNRDEEKEKNAESQQAFRFRCQLIFRERGNQKRAVGEGSEQSSTAACRWVRSRSRP